ncbi:MAG TPA: hypothetical protein VHJ20_10870 [Polyangia bacterium]|nr:hypothetical protein [Polyangia bacterium]
MTFHRSAPFVLAAAVAGSLAAGLAGATVQPRGPLLHLDPPANVTAATRAELRARMNRHGSSMSSLLRAVVLLDRRTVATMAQRIADEELLARQEERGLDRWRPLLPRGFFIEQDALRTAARELALAATDGSPDAVLADHFGALTRTCVRCHGAYLHEPPPSGVVP